MQKLIFWWIIETSVVFLTDLVGCVISDGIKDKDIYIGLNAKKYLAQLYKHVAKFPN